MNKVRKVGGAWLDYMMEGRDNGVEEGVRTGVEGVKRRRGRPHYIRCIVNQECILELTRMQDVSKTSSHNQSFFNTYMYM